MSRSACSWAGDRLGRAIFWSRGPFKKAGAFCLEIVSLATTAHRDYEEWCIAMQIGTGLKDLLQDEIRLQSVLKPITIIVDKAIGRRSFLDE